MGEEADKRTEERKKENVGSGKEGRERERKDVGSRVRSWNRGSVIEKGRRKTGRSSGEEARRGADTKGRRKPGRTRLKGEKEEYTVEERQRRERE
jgi:hypothetical protein